MPQLDFSTYSPQLIWLLISFVALYLLMARIALPRIGGVLEQRRDRIAADLDEAARLKDETEEAIASYEAALAEARSRAHAIAGEARQKLSAELDEERAKAEARIAEQTEAAAARIAAMKQSALGEVSKAASTTAQAIVQSLIGAKVSQSEADSAVKSVQDERALIQE